MKHEANRDSVPIYSQEEIKQNAVNGFLAFQKGCRQSKRKLFFRKGVLLFFLILLVGLGFSLWQIWSIDRKIPSTMYVKKGTNPELFFDVPATGEIVAVQGMGKSNIPQGSVTIDMKEKVTMVADSSFRYSMKVRLFGWLPFKEVDIKVVDDKSVIPLGIPVGLYLKTDGLLVVGTGEFENAKGDTLSPSSKLLFTGDYILEVNNKEMKKKQDLLDAVEAGHGMPVNMKVQNDGEIRYVTIKPELDRTGQYKLGIWVKDSAQGIGTLTYVDAQGDFGALGHGISDVDTGNLIECEDGTVYRTNIVRIQKGQKGTPGELTGRIFYSDDNILADIESNQQKGIYGSLRGTLDTSYGPMQIALKQEIKKGKAYILSAFSGEPTLYEIEITSVNLDNDNVNRGIVLKVTDERLLEQTGGIVQGMSGSPILQNDKIIGAVTHVFVDNPRKGYGIFLETMLEP